MYAYMGNIEAEYFWHTAYMQAFGRLARYGTSYRANDGVVPVSFSDSPGVRQLRGSPTNVKNGYDHSAAVPRVGFRFASDPLIPASYDLNDLLQRPVQSDSRCSTAFGHACRRLLAKR